MVNKKKEVADRANWMFEKKSIGAGILEVIADLLKHGFSVVLSLELDCKEEKLRQRGEKSTFWLVAAHPVSPRSISLHSTARKCARTAILQKKKVNLLSTLTCIC